ncbi:MAG: hypothetical protein Q9M12_05455 [Mariprofundus sp.]|nr:hypothetical protein [Mariprofundus sp.]
MPDAFVWYHAGEKQEPDLLNWLDTVEQQAGVRGKLFIRKTNGNTTFMETYSDVSRATIDRIEKLAASSPLFERIDRRCESFVEIS